MHKYCKSNVNMFNGAMNVEITTQANNQFDHEEGDDPENGVDSVMELVRALFDSCINNPDLAEGRVTSWKAEPQKIWEHLSPHPAISVHFEVDTTGIPNKTKPNTNGNNYKFLYAAEALELTKQYIANICGMNIALDMSGSGHEGPFYSSNVGYFDFSITRENLSADVISKLQDFVCNQNRAKVSEGAVCDSINSDP